MGGALATAVQPVPRLGFLGTGWIGRSRMETLLRSGLCTAAVIGEPSADAATAARELAPHADVADSFEDMLERDLDGLVIATPSALHAAQSIAALERGLAVFCQKPLGRSAEEVRAVVAASRKAGRPLGVDLSYRYTTAMQQIRELVRNGALGDVFAADLVFHNAYGPDKPWFYDRAQSGGGCVIDLGVHLVDLALWLLEFPALERVTSALHAGGKRLAPGAAEVEDHAVATLELAGGVTVRLACSWRLHAGREAVIGAAFHGTQGGAALSNVDGSFYDFCADRFSGTFSDSLSEPPDDWGGRAIAAWAVRLARGEGFDEARGRELVAVAEALDRIYAAG